MRKKTASCVLRARIAAGPATRGHRRLFHFRSEPSNSSSAVRGLGHGRSREIFQARPRNGIGVCATSATFWSNADAMHILFMLLKRQSGENNCDRRDRRTRQKSFAHLK